MLYTVAHAKAELPAVISLNAGDPRFMVKLNEAQRILMQKGPWFSVTRSVRLCVESGCVTLPPFIKKIYKISPGSNDGYVHGKWYEFMDGGPGVMDEPNALSIGSDLVDRGFFPTFRELPKAMRVMVFSDVEEAATSTITVYGLDQYRREIYTDGLPGETIKITKTTPQYTRATFTSITSVKKPVTNGVVYLNGFIPDPVERVLLASYGQRDTSPQYRRYAPSGCSSCCSLTALVKLDHVELVYDSDPLLIQSLDALKMMLMANRYYESKEVQQGQAYEAMAMVRLTESNADADQDNQQMSIRGDLGFGELNNAGVY